MRPSTPQASGALQDRVLLRSEFAMVEVRVEDGGNGPGLRIRDTDTGETILLDPLELEALTRMRHAQFGQLVLRDGELSGGTPPEVPDLP